MISMIKKCITIARVLGVIACLHSLHIIWIFIWDIPYNIWDFNYLVNESYLFLIGVTQLIALPLIFFFASHFLKRVYEALEVSNSTIANLTDRIKALESAEKD